MIPHTDSGGANPHFLGSEIEQPLFEKALFHVVPIPLERSVSYAGGTALGPAAILHASWQLEKWDGKSNPCDEGIYTHNPIDCDQNVEQVMQSVARLVQEISMMGKIPVALGGEHAVTQGVVRGILDAGITDFGIVQIDAHADLRDQYEGDPYSHASVIKRIIGLGLPVVQLGVRALCDEEISAREQYGVVYHDAEELVTGNISEILLPDNFPEKVFVTVDVDGLDPSVFPSTGTPVPGGLGWYQTLGLLKSIAKQKKIIGFDVVEFSPIENFHCYDFSAALLTYQLMGIVQRAGFTPSTTKSRSPEATKDHD